MSCDEGDTPSAGERADWPRTWLFAPADQERKLAGALGSGAGAVIADLEDAVAPAGKAVARTVARRFARRDGGPWRVVRINDVRTREGQDDLRAVGGWAPDAVVVPKATLESVETALEVTPKVVALIETAVGVRDAERIAGLEGVLAIALGGIDLAAELGLQALPNGHELLFVRSKLVLDGAAAGGIPVIDRVFPHLADEAGLKADSERARALGLRGKLCIHPAQLPVVEAAFTPSSAEVSHAKRVVAGYEESRAEGVGAVMVDGEMVDLATVRRAQRVLLGRPGHS